MGWQYLAYIAPLLVAALVSGGLALYAWRRRSVPGAAAFAWLMLAVTVWSATYAAELSAVDFTIKYFWLRAEYLGLVNVPVAWLAFTLQYTGRGWRITIRNLAFLLAIPTITILLAWTNQAHGLIWREMVLDTDGVLPVFDLTYGLWCWIHIGYSYFLLLVGTLLIFQAHSKGRASYRQQASILLFAALLPWVGNALYIFDLGPVPNLDLGSFAFTLTGLLIAWGLFRFRFLDLVPVARETVVESMSDGAFVLDASNRIVDANPAAERIAGHPLSELIGQPAAQAFSDVPDLFERFRDVSEAQVEIVLGEGQAQRMYDLRISPLQERQDRLPARLVVLHDITALKEAEAARRKRTEQMKALQETVLGITAQRDLSTLLETIVERATRLLNATIGGLYLCDPKREQVRCVVSHNTPRDYRGTVLPYGEGAAGRVAQTGEPLLIEDYSTWEGRAAVFERGRPFRAVIAAPMIWQDQVIGVIDATHHEEDRQFTQADQELLVLLANHAAIAVQNARFLEEARSRWQEAETLRRAGMALSETLGLDETLTRILQQLGKVVPYDSASIQLLREGYTEVVGGLGFENPEVVIGLRFPVPGENPNTVVIERREPIIIDDVSAEQVSFQTMPHESVSAWMGVPLMIGDRIVGMVTAESVEQGYFNTEHIRLAMPFANQAAVAIENARLYEEAQAQLQLAQTLQRVGALLTAEMTPDEVFEELFDLLSRVVSYDSVSIFVPDDTGGVEMAAHRGFDDVEAVRQFVAGLEWEMLANRWGQKSVALIPDTHEAESWFVVQGVAHIRSWLGAALVVRGRLIGELNVDSKRVGAYDASTAETVAAFANQAAVAIENARLHEEVQAYAQELELRVEERMADLRAEQEKVEAILGSVGEAIVMTDLDIRIQYVNQAFTTLTGYSADQALGKRANELLGGYMTEQDRLAARLARNEGRPWQVELTIQRNDGRTYEAFMSTVPMRDAKGNVVGYVSSHHDISARKELDRARRRFMNNVSHELRTPVSNMKLYAQLARSGRRPDKLDQYLRVLEEQSDRLIHLVDDIIKITDFDSGQIIESWKPLSVNTLVSDVLTRYHGQAEAKELTMKALPIPTDLPSVKGDQVRLSQALNEVVENAITFTPPGGSVTIRVDVSGWEDRAWVRVAVCDTGPGISPDEQEQVFDRFYRGHLAESGTVPGTGLGLSVVSEILRAHGGRVTLESEEGQGSTVTLWLRSEV